MIEYIYRCSFCGKTFNMEKDAKEHAGKSIENDRKARSMVGKYYYEHTNGMEFGRLELGRYYHIIDCVEIHKCEGYTFVLDCIHRIDSDKVYIINNHPYSVLFTSSWEEITKEEYIKQLNVAKTLIKRMSEQCKD